MSFSDRELEVSVTDKELGEFLAGIFDENEEEDRPVSHIIRSNDICIRGEIKRLRLSNYISVNIFQDIENTLANIGATNGTKAKGLLLKKHPQVESIQTDLFKILTFEDIARWTLLKVWIDTIDITLDGWLTLWKKIGLARSGEVVTDKECSAVFRFNTICGRVRLTNTCKVVADAFHDSMHGFGLVSTPHRGTGGLVEFEFPGSAHVSAARKKICLL